MNFHQRTCLFFAPLLGTVVLAQTGRININVYDEFTKKPVAATVSVGNSSETYTGIGNVQIDNLAAGTYSFTVSAPGYTSGSLSDISVVPNQNLTFSVGLNQVREKNIQEVVLSKKLYKTTAESPVSLRNITSEEVQKNAGSNRDVSKALLSLPGVGTTATFRNDLFIRGGSSAENRFYIDGIEVPVINHFQTQGASGGPKGIITIDFVKDIDFYSGAFPAKRNGTLSSLMEFSLKQARKDKIGYKGVIGFDDLQLMADGPLSKDQSWSGLFSIRRSNLQFLFKLMGVPFLPSYTDATFKIQKKYRSGDELYFLVLGAKDNFKFNDKPNETLYNLTLIERLPVAPQWNYTFGAGYRHLTDNGNWLFTWSRNMLDNRAKKYYRNVETPENLLLDYHSREMENKLRVDRSFHVGNVQMGAGANLSFSDYTNTTFAKNVVQSGLILDRYQSELSVMQYGAYVHGNTKLANGKVELSTGLRIDAGNYSSHTSNPLKQLSPRISLKYRFAEHLALNANTGVYYMLPSYTALGFRMDDALVNKNTLRYIRNMQAVAGLEYNGQDNLRITAEGYYKKYDRYPFSLRNQISLANLGGDFGVVGTEPLDSRGKGEAYGLEFLAQKRTVNDFYGIASYTFGYSRFSDAAGQMVPSSWDSRHILSVTAGKYFAKNWNVGARFRLQSGFPQTPYNMQLTPLVSVWNVANGPVYDYRLLNTERGNLVHQLDIRGEKKWIFNKWQLTFYMDMVNAYGSKNPSALPVLALERDTNGNPIIMNPTAPQNQQMYQLDVAETDRTRPLPYFGLIVEF